MPLKKEVRIKTKDIAKVSVQYKNNSVLIEAHDELLKLYDNTINKDYKLHNFAFGSKGWLYWIKCYNFDGKMNYNFYILSDNMIRYNNRFYTTDDIIDLTFFERLFDE